jgi:hypothetical protein
VPGAKVTLCRQPLDAQIQMNGFTTLVEPDAKVQATSDTEGRFALDLSSDGNFVVFADAEGYARAQFGPAQLAASKGVQDLVLALDAGGTLEGKVLMPPGRSAAGVIVGINRGDALPFTQIAGSDGAFRFERLTAGPWEIRRCEAMFEGATSTTMSSGDDTKPGELRKDFVIAAGQTTHHDLDLRDKQPCVLEIELTNNSQPARAWSVVAWSTSQHVITGALPSGSTDSSGRLRLEIEDSGETLLTITPPAESGSEFKAREPITLQRGSNNWTHDLRTGRIEGTISGWQPDAGVRWIVGGSEMPSSAYLEIRPDALGHFVVPYIETGKTSVKRVRLSGAEQILDEVQNLDLAAGTTKILQLP